MSKFWGILLIVAILSVILAIYDPRLYNDITRWVVDVVSWIMSLPGRLNNS